MWRNTASALLSSAVLLISVSPVLAQQVKKSTISGTAQSLLAECQGTPTALGNFDASHAFIITQICTETGASISGSTLGGFSIALPSSGCRDFVPGIALPADEDLTCTGAPSRILVNGVVVKP